MVSPVPSRAIASPGEILPPEASPTTVDTGAMVPTPGGEAVLAAAQAWARKAAAPAILRTHGRLAALVFNDKNYRAL
jgi:hypothetical protein